MPSISQVRYERIQKLIEYFKDKEAVNIDMIQFKARRLFPMLTKGTIKSYAETVLRILTTKTESEKP